jgi:hypothetical protein
MTIHVGEVVIATTNVLGGAHHTTPNVGDTITGTGAETVARQGKGGRNTLCRAMFSDTHYSVD